MGMMPVCLHCFEVFDPRMINWGEPNSNLCPRLRCNYDLVQIDENMIPLIFELTKKGYFTTDCCSGHHWDTGRIGDKASDAFTEPGKINNLYFSIYVLFEENILIPNPPKGFIVDMEHFEKWWDPEKFSEEHIAEKQKETPFKCSIRKKYNSDELPEDPNPLEIQRYIFNSLNALLEWAMALPTLKEEKPEVTEEEDPKPFNFREMTTTERLKEEILKDAGYHQGVHETVRDYWFFKKDQADNCAHPDKSGWMQETPHLSPHVLITDPLHLILTRIGEHHAAEAAKYNFTGN